MTKATKKEWFLDRYCGRQFAALLENGKLTEFFSENEPRTTCVGNIYKGTIVNVVSGMNAAFINCGLPKNCYLSLSDPYTEYSKYDGTMVEMSHNKPILKEGDEVIVQLTTLARGNKGAKVSMHLSFVGKRVIYLPNTSFLGISRKITDSSQREKLLIEAEKMRDTEKEGFVIRTQAPYASSKQLKSEAEYLKKLYLDVQQKAESAPTGTLLYEPEDLPARVIRDSFEAGLSALYVGDETLYERLLAHIRIRGDIPERKLIKYTGNRTMVQSYGLSKLLRDAASPKVPLDNGGYLVIEHTEAMTVVDVNTGKFTGDSNLEETAFEMNLAAVKEIARQVRLRNIGGIIVVDFIDMVDELHKVAITAELKNALALDSARCNVLPMSELCITQFTRKRLGDNVQSFLVKPCSCCGGIGHVPDDIFVITQIRTAILNCFADGSHSVIVDLNEHILNRIFQEQLFSIEAKNRWKNNKVYFVPHKTYKEAEFSLQPFKTTPPSLPENAQKLT